MAHLKHHVNVTQTPFGMSVQTGCIYARVLHVLPDYPAHAAGICKGFVLVKINDQPVSGETWEDVYLNTELPFSMTFITPTHMALAQVPGMQDTALHFIVRRILTGVTGPGFFDIPAHSMMTFCSEITDQPVILLDGSGSEAVDIFSLGAVVWNKQQHCLAEHYCGISLEHDPLDIGRAASGHIGEALALAIVLGSIYPRIQSKGGKLGAIVMDSLNWVSNLTTTKPSNDMDKVLRLLSHELAGHDDVLIINREAYGRFANIHNWPPHRIASCKHVTHKFLDSATMCPSTQESKNFLHFTKLWQIGAGTRHPDGTIGDMLVGVVVRTVGPVQAAIPWWLTRVDPNYEMAASFKPADDRYVMPPMEVIKRRRLMFRENMAVQANMASLTTAVLPVSERIL